MKSIPKIRQPSFFVCGDTSPESLYYSRFHMALFNTIAVFFFDVYVTFNNRSRLMLLYTCHTIHTQTHKNLIQ